MSTGGEYSPEPPPVDTIFISVSPRDKCDKWDKIEKALHSSARILRQHILYVQPDNIRREHGYSPPMDTGIIGKADKAQ